MIKNQLGAIYRLGTKRIWERKLDSANKGALADQAGAIRTVKRREDKLEIQQKRLIKIQNRRKHLQKI